MRSPPCFAQMGAAIRVFFLTERPAGSSVHCPPPASGEYQPSFQRMPLERLGGHNAVDYQKEEPWPDPERLTISRSSDSGWRNSVWSVLEH